MLLCFNFIQMERQTEISGRKLEELKKKASLMEELVNEKQNLVSKLQERSKVMISCRVFLVTYSFLLLFILS